MGVRSSIEQLPPPIKAAVDDAIKAGASIDSIVETIRALGGDASRSAVGRYSQKYAQLAAQHRQMVSVAQSFGREFGEEGDLQVRLMNQMLTSVVTRVIMPIAAGDDPDLTGKELSNLARAVKDATSSSKIDVEREARIRDEATKRAREQAAVDAADTARKAGASQETIDRIKASILGIAA